MKARPPLPEWADNVLGSLEPPPPAGPEDYGFEPRAAPANERDDVGVLHDHHIAQVGWSIAFSPPLTIDEWLARDLPDPDFLMGDWLTTTSRTLLVASTGLGKTHFALDLGMAVAAGTGFLHWRARRPAKGLYIDGEMSRRLLKKRIADAVERLGCRPAGFHAVSHEDIPNFRPLNTPEGRAQVEHLIKQHGPFDLIIFDSVMCLTVGDMKDEESWQQTLPWVRSLTARGIGQIWVHHTGHDETRSYGTKTREWQMDTVLLLEGAKREDTDVSFTLDFRKARERTPATRADFQVARVALVGDIWKFELTDAKRPAHVAPVTLKFLDALNNALADTDRRVQGRAAATAEEWKAECGRMGLIDLTDNEKASSARALFSKHRRVLIAANRIACDGDLSWTL